MCAGRVARRGILTGVVVIVPVFRRAETVRLALDSVASQSRPPRRVVVVDDGSGDATLSSVRAWAADQAALEVVVLAEPHRGVSRARNRGLEHALEPFVAFLDSDDRWPPDLLERAHRAFSERPELIAASADQGFQSGRARLGLRTLEGLSHDPTRWLLRNDGGVLSATVLRAEPVRRLGFAEELRTGQDYELLLRLSLLGPWSHLPGAPVIMGAPHGGEHPHLSAALSDRHARWARILERFMLEHGHERRVPAALAARWTGDRWARAAREMAASGQLVAAARCAGRAGLWWSRSGRSVTGRTA